MFLLTATSSTATATETFTTLHLILIAVLIVLVIAAILWGARQKQARAAGEHEEATRTDALLAHPQTETAVSPASPPLGDSGMTAGAAMPQPVVTAPVAKPAPKPVTTATATAKVAVKPAAKATPVKSAPTKAPAVKAASASKPATAKPAPKAVAAKPAAKPAATPAPAPAPAVAAYDLIDVKGLGPKAVPLLEAQGVRDLAALAALSPARAAEIDAGLGALSGRLGRDRWIEQAKLLAAGDVATFEATYGKL